MTFQWSEKELCWLVIHDGNVVDKVGMQYAEQNPNWKTAYCTHCGKKADGVFCPACRTKLIEGFYR